MEIEYVELFNENILIKQKNKQMMIHNIFSNKYKQIPITESLDDFILVY